MKLTKSDYIKYLQCEKELWLYKMRGELMSEVDENAQRIFDIGYEVEKVAYEIFPEGVETADNNGQSIKETKDLMQKNTPVIFQATVSSDELFCRADIVEYDEQKDVWNIIEVKSSSGVKNTHIHDLAFQKICFESVEYKVGNLSVMHINNEYIKDGDIVPAEFLSRTDVTEKVEEIVPETKTKYKMH